jgi:predicted  nucleic acid-binding Zn-ribbon protein
MVRRVEPDDLERQFEALEARLRPDFQAAFAKLAQRQTDEGQQLWRSLNALANEQRDLAKSYSRMTEELRQVSQSVEQVEDQLSSLVNALATEHRDFASALVRLEVRIDRLRSLGGANGGAVHNAGAEVDANGVTPVGSPKQILKK